LEILQAQQKAVWKKDVFSKSFTKLSPENSIDEALQTMNRDGTKFGAVVNENDRLLGVVNRHNFLNFQKNIASPWRYDLDKIG
jgi:CBS domain-containing protein